MLILQAINPVTINNNFIDVVYWMWIEKLEILLSSNTTWGCVKTLWNGHIVIEVLMWWKLSASMT